MDSRTAVDQLESLGVLAATIDGAWVSHSTALQTRSLWVPETVLNELHLSRPRGSRAARHARVKGHQFVIDSADLGHVDGVPTSSIPRAWREAAAQMTVRELVQLGDFLVRVPRPAFEGRSEPYTTIDQLTEMVRKYPVVPGAKRAAVAAALVRVGSDSPPESDCRLAIVGAGLPEPELQVALHPGDRYSPTLDLGYRKWKIGMQYEGAVHRSAERHSTDLWRDREFATEGWTVLGIGHRDRAEGFFGLIRQLKRLIPHL